MKSTLGNLTQGKRGTPNHKVHDIRLKDEADWIHAEASHEALISPDDFMVGVRTAQTGYAGCG